MSHVLIVWSINDFGSLDKVRELVAGTTFEILGLQTFFGGFFLAIVNGNAAELTEFERIKRPPTSDPGVIDVAES